MRLILRQQFFIILFIVNLDLFGFFSTAQACACGCGVFDVGLPGLPVTGVMNQISVQYDFMNQNWNHSGATSQPGNTNPDQQIGTNYYTLSGQHMFNENWGVQVMLPYWQRTFSTDISGTPGQINPSPNYRSANISNLSDVKIMGMYSGFSPDKSSGILFGLKLPTGATNSSPLFDRDVEPGTGTTDTLLGIYSVGNFNMNWGWYNQSIWRHAINHYQGYKPGDEINIATGINYEGITSNIRVIPLIQINLMWRQPDQGGGDAINGNRNSGYTDVYFTPGTLFIFNKHWQANSAVYLPIYRYVNGVQLVPHWMFNAGISYLF